MTTTQIKARMYLHAILPQLLVVCAEDEQASTLIQSWHATIQLQILGGPAARLVYRDKKVTFHPSATALPDLGLLFLSAKSLVGLFEGKSITPIPWIGLWRKSLVRGLPILTKRLRHYVTLDTSDGCDETEARTALSIRLGALVRAAAVLAATVPEIGQLLEHAPNGLAVLRAPGITPVFAMKTGNRLNVVNKEDETAQPSVFLEFETARTGLEVLTGGLDVWKAIGEGRFRMRGHLLLADAFLEIVDITKSYLQD